MLGSLKLGLGIAQQPAAGGGSEADYIIADNSDWTTLMALSDSELSGKTAEITGTLTNITLRDGIAPAAGLTITSSGSGSVNTITIADNENITFSNRFQMTGWPADYDACVQFVTGTSTNLTFDGATFRHGYGPSLVDFDTDFQYPEMDRPTSIQTATASSVTYALPWDDPAATSGRLFIFNNGSQPAYIAVGGPGVTATTGDTLIPVSSSGYVRISADPTTDTHYAIITASGTTEINTRPEIGMIYYLPDAFSSFGSSVISGGITVQNCTFTDLSNACKGLPGDSSGSSVFWKNTFQRIYQDIIALSLRGEDSTWIVDNLWCIPFSRTGIAQDLFGDANDPHGDLYQMFSTGVETISNIYLVGNRTVIEPLRTGAYAQGFFISDNDFNPSYSDIYSVGNFIIGGAQNGVSSGEASYPAQHVISYGDTIVNWEEVDEDTKFRTYTANVGDAVVKDSIVGNGILNDSGASNTITDGYVNVQDVVDSSALFPDWDDRLTATTRAEIVAAWTGAAEASGKGFAAVSSLLNFDAGTAQGVFDSDSAPPMVGWDDITGQSPSTVVALGARKVIFGGTVQTVTPGGGTEVQITSDGSTIVTDWTSSPTTVDAGQWVNIRVTTSSDSLDSVTASAVINGYTVSANVETEVVLGSVFTLAATSSFEDTANCPSGVEVVEYQFKGQLNSDTSGFDNPFSHVSAMRFQLDGNATTSSYRIQVEDSAGSIVLDDTSAFGTLNDLIPTGTPLDMTLVVDYSDPGGANPGPHPRSARLTINGVSQTVAFTAVPATEYAQNNRKFVFNGNTTSADLMPSGTEVEHFRIYTTISGTRTLHKEVSIAEQGSIAGINADAWHTGDNVT